MAEEDVKDEVPQDSVENDTGEENDASKDVTGLISGVKKVSFENVENTSEDEPVDDVIVGNGNEEMTNNTTDEEPQQEVFVEVITHKTKEVAWPPPPPSHDQHQ